MRRCLIAVVVLLSAAQAFSQVDPNASALNVLYEQGPLNTVVPHVANQGYGEPRVIQSGAKVRMYTGGVDDFSSTSVHDKVFHYENDNTWTGWNSPYTKVGVILPKNCTSGANECRTNYNYTLHWVWQSPTRVYMIAATGAVLNEWPEVLLGESTDGGITFNWSNFLKTTNGVHFVKISWQPITIGTVQYLYGYADFKYHGDQRADHRDGYGIGAIRFKPSSSAPFLVDSAATLEVWAPGGWQQVSRCGSGFTFCLNVDPLIVYPNERFPNFFKMARYNDALELWTMIDASNQADVTCQLCPSEDRVRQNAFGYRAVNYPRTTADDPFLLILSKRRLLKQQVNAPLRCMPGRYGHSRKHPARLEWTYNLIYSRTFDKPGVLDQCPPEGRVDGSEGWIVATQLTTVP